MHTLSLLFLALGLAGTVAAQAMDPALDRSGDAGADPSRTVRLAASAVAGGEVVTDVAADGTLWAAGPSWKAAFGVDGATFVPCFGAAAPRNFPARLGRATVRVAGETLAGSHAAPVFGKGEAEFQGRTFTERYLLLPAGIEQQFVFSTLPSRGAIELEVPFATDLAVAAAGAAAGFRVTGEFGSYEYGAAVAIDAHGRRLALSTAWTGNGFRIQVPAQFVAEAALPLVVDPLIGNVTAFTSDTRMLAATDLAWDESMSRYALVYERVFSATDSDIYLRYLDGAMQIASNAVAIDISLDSWRRPHVAGLEAHDSFLTVAERSTGNVAPFTVFARQVTGTTPAMQAALQIGGNECRHPDVGGDPSPVGPSNYCIVYESVFTSTDHDIVYDVRNANLGLVTNGYVDGLTTNAISPRIGKSCGAPGGGTEGWGMAYLREVGGGLNQPMFACLSRGLGFSVGPRPWAVQVPNANCSIAVSSPTDHAQGRRYLTCAQYDGANSEYARGYVFDRTGAQICQTGTFGSGTPIEGEASIDSDGTRFVIANYHRSPGNSNPWVSINLYGIGGQFLSYAESASVGGTATLAPSVVARRSGGGGERTYGLAWAEMTSATAARLLCANYDGIQGGVQLAVRYTSCGGLGFLSGGESVLGGTVSLQLVANSGLQGFVVGLPVDLPLGFCPGCRQGADGSIVFAQTYSFVVPRNAAFLGLTVAFQGFQFTLPGTGGACLGQINLSNTLDATIR